MNKENEVLYDKKGQGILNKIRDKWIDYKKEQ
jgi:hypothetical protein